MAIELTGLIDWSGRGVAKNSDRIGRRYEECAGFFEMLVKASLSLEKRKHIVEINEDQPKEKTQGYLFKACYTAKQSATVTCFGRDSKVGSLIVAKGEGFRYA